MCLGIPAKVIECWQDETGGLPMARVDYGNVTATVCIAFTPEAQAGDYVLIHVGFSLSIIDENHAQELREFLNEEDSGS